MLAGRVLSSVCCCRATVKGAAAASPLLPSSTYHYSSARLKSPLSPLPLPSPPAAAAAVVIRSMSADLRAMRKAYHDKKEVLLENDILPKMSNPFDIFHEWFEAAKASEKSYTEVNAVCLATATKEGKPSSRMVLLKSYDPVNGFTIFTNYESRKGSEIDENPNVALLFFWDFLSRQIRVEGKAKRVPASESDEYFGQRPRASQVSARISAQSQPVDSRDTLLKRQKEEADRWAADEHIPRPDFWGGFHIIPERFEFWQGQSDRLHDRLVFTRSPPPVNGQQEVNGGDKEKEWSVQRLQP